MADIAVQLTDLQFMHEDTYYYRNQQMIALNQHYGDIFNIIIGASPPGDHR